MRSAITTPVQTYSTPTSEPFGFRDVLGLIPSITGTVSGFIGQENARQIQNRQIAADRDVAMARYGAGRDGAYALAPPAYAYAAQRAYPTLATSSFGGGLGALTPYLPFAALALVAMLMLRR